MPIDRGTGFENPNWEEKLSEGADDILKGNFEEGFYEIYTDSQTELYNKLLLLKDFNNNFFSNSKDAIITQIALSKTGKERAFLEEQIEELEEIYSLYREYLKVGMTKKTNQELSKLFSEVVEEIGKGSPIEDDKEYIEEYIEWEKERLDDNIIDSSYRDLVEKNIDIKWQFESIYETDEVSDVYELFTIEYINILESKNDRIGGVDMKKGLDINAFEAENIILKIIKKLNLTQDKNKPSFDKIKIKTINGETINISIANSIEKEKNREKIAQIFDKLGSLFRKNDYKGMYESKGQGISAEGEKLINELREKSKLFSREEILYLLQENTVGKNKFMYVPFLEAFGLGELNTKVIYHALSQYILDKTITIDKKKVKFSREFINENIKDILHNLKIFFSYMMVMETKGGRNDLESSSGAKGVLQFLDGYKGGRKIKEGQWSFQTALNRTKAFWGRGNIPEYIKEADSWGGKLDVNKFGPDEQLSIWIPDALMYREIDNNKASRLLMGIMVGNVWSAKKYYQEYHNTENGKKVSDLVKRRTGYFFGKFKQIK